MKLASLPAGRDGRLVAVSHDLARMTDASGIAPTLQAAGRFGRYIERTYGIEVFPDRV